ncbi:linoleate 13S-lipoxygenase 2-1, chloroplastic-like [Aristolochia californica]|uniref:linoleate 13S-lipoxygenase 2-1, chloroplastic-like n=1 Tax=Aristolochia californica TaxID=171875 RepID=UPI0035DD2589
MLKPQLQRAHHSPSSTLAPPKTIVSGYGRKMLHLSSTTTRRYRVRKAGRVSSSYTEIDTVEQLQASDSEDTTEVTATVNVQSSVGLSHGLDDISDLLGKSIFLELVSTQLEPNTGEEQKIEAFAQKVKEKDDVVKYEATFQIGKDFGEVGAVLVTNEHHKETYLRSITLTGFPHGPVNFTCNSWVQPKSDKSDQKRVFFTNKSYLPADTPSGLKRLREKDLEALRGNGEGERKCPERIYDFDKYNDLGDPDKSPDLARPICGGEENPYPRRCRTGRPPTKADPLAESRSNRVYVPRDEAFSEVKQLTFSARTLKSVMKSLVPSIGKALNSSNHGFPYFAAIDSLYHVGINLPKPKEEGFFKKMLPRLVKAIATGGGDLLLFETPQLLGRDRFSWFRDEEFSRQTLAGVNPTVIQLIKELPLRSELDPEVYGPAESLITKEVIEEQIKGAMTAEEAIKQKKLFIIDYHDLLLPFVHKVREQEESTLYGSRTVFFLTHDGTLRPLAIELTRPKSKTQPQWRQVFIPGFDATTCWLWRLAKAHVCAHDTGFHQLISHWLKTHAATEPYIIASKRRLSAMHPIYRLLHPHFRYTMEINALAREYLINAGGIIEKSFWPKKYSMEVSSAAYAKLWRFDLQSLPEDLISRGMAEEDPTAEHGLKLAIEDYPFANDGLLLWSAIKEWVTEYVSHYYPSASLVTSDTELQSWWAEIKTKGHPDKTEGWPPLSTPSHLIYILSTMIWVSSGLHAAVNFGQYSYGGYFPNRPTIARTKVPTEDSQPGTEGFQQFMEKPELTLLECFPSQKQAMSVMAILDVLSNHSPDEEYLGEKEEGAWKEDPVIAAAFESFSGKLKQIEGIIDGRNTDLGLKNRTGAGVVPYTLLKPFSEPGVTGMGVPNSISI